MLVAVVLTAVVLAALVTEEETAEETDDVAEDEEGADVVDGPVVGEEITEETGVVCSPVMEETALLAEVASVAMLCACVYATVYVVDVLKQKGALENLL